MNYKYLYKKISITLYMHVKKTKMLNILPTKRANLKIVIVSLFEKIIVIKFDILCCKFHEA